MNFQSLGSWFLKGPQKLGIQFLFLILFQWKLKVIYFGMQWINMRKKNSIYIIKTFLKNADGSYLSNFSSITILWGGFLWYHLIILSPK